MNCKVIICVVPDQRKSTSVYDTLFGGISMACPPSTLRKHPNARRLLDLQAESQI